MLDENEFLSEGGIRALSKYHKDHPFVLQLNHNFYSVGYLPGDSDNSMFGGNSNWRGPVWMPLNYLIIKTLQQLHDFYGDDFLMSFPTGSENKYNLQKISGMLSSRLTGIFQLNTNGLRKVNGDESWFYQLPENKGLVLFYEYYHGDNARGVGASHQTGWSSLVASLIDQDL